MSDTCCGNQAGYGNATRPRQRWDTIHALSSAIPYCHNLGLCGTDNGYHMINILPGPKKSDPTLVEPFNAATAPLNDPTALWGV